MFAALMYSVFEAEWQCDC